MSKILDEALKLPAAERMVLAERLFESVETDDNGDQDDDDNQRAWAEELQRRSRELHEGSVKGLSVEEARRLVASEPSADES